MKTQKPYTFFTKIIFLWRCFHVDCGWCCCAFVSSGSALVNVLGLVLTSVQPRLWNIPLSPKVEACHLWLGKIECFNELWFTAWSKLVRQNTLEGVFFIGIKAFLRNRVPLSPLKTLLKNHTQFKICCFLLIRSLLRQETSMAAIFNSFPGSPGLFHCTCASAAHDGSPPVCHCNNTSTLTSFWGKGQRARI